MLSEFSVDFMVAVFQDGLIRLINATVDGTGFALEEPKPFHPNWYSRKYKWMGLNTKSLFLLREKLCGQVVSMRAKKILMLLYIEILKNNLLSDELVLEDNSYIDLRFLKLKRLATIVRCHAAVLLGRHETVKGRLKTFRVL